MPTNRIYAIVFTQFCFPRLFVVFMNFLDTKTFLVKTRQGRGSLVNGIQKLPENSLEFQCFKGRTNYEETIKKNK